MTSRWAVTRARCWCRRCWRRASNWAHPVADAAARLSGGLRSRAELLARELDALPLEGWHPTAVLGTVGAGPLRWRICTGFRRKSDATRSHSPRAWASGPGGQFRHHDQAGCTPVRRGLCDRGRAPPAWASPPRPTRRASRGFSPRSRPKARRARAPGPPAWAGDCAFSIRLSIKKYPMCYATHRVIDCRAPTWQMRTA